MDSATIAMVALAVIGFVGLVIVVYVVYTVYDAAHQAAEYFRRQNARLRDAYDDGD